MGLGPGPLAAGSLDDVVAKPGAGVTEAGDLCAEVVDDEVDAVPAAGAIASTVPQGPQDGLDVKDRRPVQRIHPVDSNPRAIDCHHRDLMQPDRVWPVR